MQAIYCSAILLFCVLNLFGQQFSATSKLVYNYPDPDLNIERSVGYGLQIEYDLSDRWSANIFYNFLPSRQSYTIPAGKVSQNIYLHYYGGRMNYKLLHIANSTSVFVLSGIGIISFVLPERSVDLGALGKKILSQQTTTHTAYSLGFVISHPLWVGFNIYFEPLLFIFATSGRTFMNYLFGGGIEFEL